MLDPNKANPQHMSEELPLDLENLSQVRKLQLLQPPATENKEHATPLLRKEWTKRERGIAMACGFALIQTLFQMAGTEAQTMIDEVEHLEGIPIIHVDNDYHKGDILDTLAKNGGSHADTNIDHHKTTTGVPGGEIPEDHKADWTDLAIDMDKEENRSERMSGMLDNANIPHTKLPFPITESTLPPAQHLPNDFPAKRLPFPITESTPPIEQQLPR